MSKQRLPRPTPVPRFPLARLSPIALALALCAAVLAACGGGGSADASPTPTPVATNPPGAGVSSPAAPGTPASNPQPSAGDEGTSVVAAFTATDADLPNPERGFYRWSQTNLDTLARADVDAAFASGYRLLFSRLDLSAYREADLSPALLAKVQDAFDRVREGGMKLVVRMVYNYPDSEIDYQNAKDASLPRVLAHIAQLKPLLQRNADVIAFMQAGFIGAWGEWHTSSNNLTVPASRNQIRDALLAALPSSRFIQLRYPAYVMDGTPELPALSAVLAGAYRVGAHNDCFLASKTDVGTYDEDATVAARQRDYIDRLGDLAPFGGETCNPTDEDNAVPRTSCADILAEGARYNLTYLNDEYYRAQFHDRWVQGGCMAEVRRKMGYRLALVSATHAASATRGQALTVRLALRNDGWARVFNPRGVQLVLKHATTGAVRRLDATGADPRAWTPGSAEQAATISAALPADLPVGVYQVSIALPDGDARLATDARYAIRWSNADNTPQGQRWDAALGAFAIGTSVTVK
ncbi:DUF4832 domain-containing protein [Mitsuaria sp. GD03876]|uniref:DUF4832 domain-containing protein n=1 Tax=Mitsuaria sp. GD03876 TaxID=2975399 RepID=UPI002449BABF|nr:DUF4832 domain-containing protein [Mitsuaria sp. GD03876]MDH0868251.1 DUF4832 domain-containing protein [Mitsuaria sp. GD03876]